MDPPPVRVKFVSGTGTVVMLWQVAWNAAKEKELWEIISRQSKGNEIDCMLDTCLSETGLLMVIREGTVWLSPL